MRQRSFLFIFLASLIWGTLQAGVLQGNTYKVLNYNQVTINELGQYLNTDIELVMDFDPEGVFSFTQTKTQTVSGDKLESRIVLAANYSETSALGKNYIEIPWAGAQSTFTYNNRILDRVLDKIEFTGGKFVINKEKELIYLERIQNSGTKKVEPFTIKMQLIP